MRKGPTVGVMVKPGVNFWSHGSTSPGNYGSEWYRSGKWPMAQSLWQFCIS
jgi:hypothetical protein